MPERRDELLEIAAELFAEKGFKNTTVRDIADAAGILSGSLYHHFDSKESMVDEILRSFLDELFGDYDDILAKKLSPRERFEAIVVASFEALDRNGNLVKTGAANGMVNLGPGGSKQEMPFEAEASSGEAC